MSQQRPVVVLTGCRQAGKTALLQHLFPTHHYVSLDVPSTAQQAEEFGERFLENQGAPLIIDEIQYAPLLLRYLKAVVDRKRDVVGQYFVTGSQKFSLMQGVTESLAGRASIVELHSLSLLEIERWQGSPVDRTDLLKWMYKGTYPEACSKNLDSERFYSDYLATYLERDVRQAIQVRSLRDFDRFMRLAASRTGQLLSMNSFAADLGISPLTVRSWLSVLEASNIIHILEPYYRNLGKRVVKTPKLYFMDTGLACFLAGIRSAADLERSQMVGALFETLVLGQIVRSNTNRGVKPSVYFFRDHHGTEVDFVIPVGEKLKLLECKWAELPSTEVKAFDAVERAIGEGKILLKSIVVPVRGYRQVKDGNIAIEDCVELKSLAK